jgi:class 3 adenylate cyclase
LSRVLGDGFLATFGSAASAVAAAVAIQQGIDGMHLPAPDVALAVRIGVSVGDVSVEDGDVFGTPVIEAARLCAHAEGGQILAAAVVEALARRRDGHSYLAHGALELKGLP